MTDLEIDTLMNIRVAVTRDKKTGLCAIRVFHDGAVKVTLDELDRTNVADNVVEMVMEQCVAHDLGPKDDQ